MKKTVTTREGHKINFTIESSNGVLADAEALDRLANTILTTFLAKSEPDFERLSFPTTSCA